MKRQTHTLAIIALVLSLVPLCFIHVIGLGLGIKALSDIKKRPNELTGNGLALAAIIIGGVWLLVPLAASIAIPNFLRFQVRARQSEATTELRALHTSALAASESGRDVTTFKELERPVDPRRRYSYFLANDVLPATVGGPHSLPDGLPAAWRAVAVGNVDNDETFDVWVLAPDGTLTNVVNDVTD